MPHCIRCGRSSTDRGRGEGWKILDVEHEHNGSSYDMVVKLVPFEYPGSICIQVEDQYWSVGLCRNCQLTEQQRRNMNHEVISGRS